MWATGSGAGWEVHAPAKLNLLFEVLARREDGYHEIETLMVPISVYDTLYLRPEPDGPIRLTCQWAAAAEAQAGRLGDLPTDRRNLAVRAVELLRTRAGIEAGATLRLVKRIPSAAGLGGGSSDAAAALVAANRAWGLNWSVADLSLLAAELGSDVPFFLTPGAAICRGRGERVEPLPRAAPLHVVVVRPPVGLATAEVFRACQVADRPHTIDALRGALERGNTAQVARLLHNRLQEPAESLSPWIGRVRRAFEAFDCLGHQMSGSGTSYFGICRHARHALRVASHLRARALGSVFAARSC